MRLLFGLLTGCLLAGAAAPELRAAQPEPAGEERYVFYSDETAFAPTEADARLKSLQDAQAKIAVYLASLDPPVYRVPSLERIERDMVRSWDPPKERIFPTPLGKMYQVTVQVELTPEQVRDLRAEQRLLEVGRGFGVVLVLLVVLAAFFRLDDWAKGYLTSWIALSIAALLVVAGVVAFMLK
ncbi:MAG TPA: hypothetical protein VIL46_18170 [Gemmataceae bacterium]